MNIQKKSIFIFTILILTLCNGCGASASMDKVTETTSKEINIFLGKSDMTTPSTDFRNFNESFSSNDLIAENITAPEMEKNDDEKKNTDNTSESDNDSSTTSTKPSIKAKGIYVTGPIAGSEKMAELIALVDSTELNTMVIDVKNDEGNLTYKMELPDGYDYDAGTRYIKNMKELNKQLHEKEIYTIGRIVCFKDPILAAARPELALLIPDGRPVTDANGLAWVNPYKEEVWDYLCTIAECASRDGFDEIQFDYIRFPIGNDANAADYGVDMSTYSREEGLNDFFAYIQERLHTQNIIFGADLFGTVIGSDIDRDRTGQSYPTLVQMADAVCPMIYPSHYAAGTFGLSVPDAHPYETISQALTLSQKELESITEGAVVRPWLQCFNAVWVDGHITYDSNAIKEQIQAVYDAGYDEWLLWNASTRYDQVADALASFSQ